MTQKKRKKRKKNPKNQKWKKKKRRRVGKVVRNPTQHYSKFKNNKKLI